MSAPSAPPKPAQSGPLRILLVRDPDTQRDDNVSAIRAGLADAGYELVSVANADLDLPARIEATQPDLLIIESEAASRDLVEHVCVSTQGAPRPIVLFTGNASSERIRDSMAVGITAYIVDGLKADRIKPVLEVAYARFQFEQQLRDELAATRNKLAERKVIERAKGLLMERHRCSEDDAYRKLRRLAMDKNLKLSDVAQRMLDVADLLI